MNDLTRWDGYAWRVESGYSHDRHTTVKDVYAHEVEELGNADIYVWGDALELLGHLPARKGTWVCSTKQAAARYGKPHKLPLHGTIVFSDSDCGYFVVRD